MFLVDFEKSTIQECELLLVRPSYKVLLIGNELFNLPIEDDTHYLCDTYSQAFSLLHGYYCVPQD